ncbi:MAG TPA: thiamine pyrophosphate-dependent enzyme [Candidatus Sabulitectum sp.]|nr:thiamine pyrophosphate-dependent enzyme [Candidatus Sabulitectum sp.]
MSIKIKDLVNKKSPLSQGHRMCPGCGAPTAVHQGLMAVDFPLVIVNATGCLEVSTTVYPFSAWRVPWIHTAFENAGAGASGVEAAYQALRKRGKIDREIKFVAFGGDGGTYDIGLQSLSGALERGHDFTYICYNNQGYMNTGAQRSSATPKGASATTSPAGSVIPGKLQKPKDLTSIAAAHHIPYVAQTTLHNHMDVITKIKRAIETPGPAFVNILVPCVLFWRIDPSLQGDICKKAAETRFWPIYEVIDGEWKLSYKPKKRIPVEEFLKPQGRYSHLFKGERSQALLEQAQADIEKDWEYVLGRCGETWEPAE